MCPCMGVGLGACACACAPPTFFDVPQDGAVVDGTGNEVLAVGAPADVVHVLQVRPERGKGAGDNMCVCVCVWRWVCVCACGGVCVARVG